MKNAESFHPVSCALYKPVQECLTSLLSLKGRRGLGGRAASPPQLCWPLCPSLATWQSHRPQGSLFLCVCCDSAGTRVSGRDVELKPALRLPPPETSMCLALETVMFPLDFLVGRRDSQGNNSTSDSFAEIDGEGKNGIGNFASLSRMAWECLAACA